MSVEIKDRTTDFAFTAIPNPSTGNDLKLFIKAKKGDEVMLVINDMSGKEILRKQFKVDDDRETLYDLDQSVRLTPGIYFISASTFQNTVREKLIVR